MSVPVARHCSGALRRASAHVESVLDSSFPLNFDDPEPSMPTPIIRATALTKIVQSGDAPLTILDAVSFDIDAGATVAIVGASGSGKTTLLGLLAGLDRPTSGEVTIDGVALSSLDEDGCAALRARVLGFVFQSFQLLPALTAQENVMLPLELAGVTDAAPRARGWLSRVGLGPRMTHYPRQLSGGEQQRVAIARAFAGEPKLLMADEPTGNLDAATGAEVADLMFRLNRENGTTLLLVTHDVALASRCERRLSLASGRLVADLRTPVDPAGAAPAVSAALRVPAK
jgi:putative ABC transport system ATP-binding protein